MQGYRCIGVEEISSAGEPKGLKQANKEGSFSLVASSSGGGCACACRYEGVCCNHISTHIQPSGYLLHFQMFFCLLAKPSSFASGISGKVPRYGNPRAAFSPVSRSSILPWYPTSFLRFSLPPFCPPLFHSKKG